MKKMILATLVSMAFAGSAFAHEYNCERPRDSHHQALEGGPGYSIAINGNSVVLIETNGSIPNSRPREILMRKVQQQPDGATFQAGNVTANIISTGIGGKLRTSVSINVKVGREDYSADCR